MMMVEEGMERGGWSVGEGGVLMGWVGGVGVGVGGGVVVGGEEEVGRLGKEMEVEVVGMVGEGVRVWRLGWW